MFLSDTKVRSAKPGTKTITLNDGGGLQLEVKPTGSKLWRYRCTISGTRTRLSIGEYPSISLKAARLQRDALKEQIAQGEDPRIKEEPTEEAPKKTFAQMVDLYLDHYREDRNVKYWEGVESLFRRDANPVIGEYPIDQIKAKQIIPIVQSVQARGALESGKRLFTQISKVFKFAVSHGEAERNPCADIDRSMILQKPTGRKYPTITDPEEIGKLMSAIDRYTGWIMVRLGLLFLAYSAARPGNVRLAEWDEIDWETKQWIIPGEKMKTGSEHIVPLSDPLLEILKQAKHYAKGGKYIFYSNRDANAPMSNVTLGKALRTTIRYSNDRIVPHGFRAMFSTIAHEKSDFSSEVIEVQLAHKIGSRVAQAYNRAQYLDQRKELMRWWGEWLEEQK
jgi:integrase